jgi:molybdate-binding protein
VAGRTILYPVEATALGVIGHDGICDHGLLRERSANRPDQTLVMASCDPAAALVATELARATPFRLLVLPRSSTQALELLGRGLVHLAGVHLAKAGQRGGNAAVVRRTLGPGYTLVRVARWQEGVALAPGLGVKSVRGALKKNLRWVGREPGSGARACLEELLESRPQPRRVARDHRGVAEAIRCGWADAGVCVRLVSEEARLEFLSVRDETYDLCYPTASSGDARLKALIEVIRSDAYRRMLGELPGYNVAHAGEVEVVK